MGLGVPVIVGGRVVAVVYADGVTEDGNEKLVPSGWPEVIEILTRHAARCLESLTVTEVCVSDTVATIVGASGGQDRSAGGRRGARNSGIAWRGKARCHERWDDDVTAKRQRAPTCTGRIGAAICTTLAVGYQAVARARCGGSPAITQLAVAARTGN